MTDAIKRLRDAALDPTKHRPELLPASVVSVVVAERILTDAVAAERARIREALLAALAGKVIGLGVEYIVLPYDDAAVTEHVYDSELVDNAITEVCGGTHD